PIFGVHFIFPIEGDVVFSCDIKFPMNLFHLSISVKMHPLNSTNRFVLFREYLSPIPIPLSKVAYS
ncbi:hypothetical protein, partial [Secundilactobacillus malefermentans]|uniref:hypothetical protein n=1 Tax=Secundilactobacillus malefermentans TaxID=176292 RepID=UPI001F2C69E0